MEQADPLRRGDAGPRDSATPAPSVTALLEELIRDLTELVRSEGRLAKAEMLDTLRNTLWGLALVAGAAALWLLAGVVLIQAVVVALAELVGPGWASLIVGVALLAIGFAVFAAGRRSLGRATLLPDRTIEQISRDGRLAQEQI